MVGPLRQALIHDWKCAHEDEDSTKELFAFIFRERAMIKAGVWDDYLGHYVEHGTAFTVVLKKTRIFKSVKPTPVQHSKEQDAEADKQRLIDGVSYRGRKVSL